MEDQEFYDIVGTEYTEYVKPFAGRYSRHTLDALYTLLLKYRVDAYYNGDSDLDARDTARVEINELQREINLRLDGNESDTSGSDWR